MSLPVITVKRLFHRKANQIGIYFVYNKSLIAKLKTIAQAKWSATHKCWYIPDSPSGLGTLFVTFKGIAWLDYTEYASAKAKKTAATGNQKPGLMVYKQKVLPDALTQINKTIKRLTAEGFSKSSINTYKNMLQVFMGFIEKEATEITKQDVEDFQVNFWVKNGYSISTQRQFLAALKHLMADLPELEFDTEMLLLPRRERQLPKVLSTEEVIGILKKASNLKHLVILSLLYSGGLRISELINLKVTDIDFDRKQIHLRRAKGRKDRYVGLSKYLEPTLRQYIENYKPESFLINGQSGPQYTSSSVRKLLSRAAEKAGIGKRVHPHMLRHSYATHMLENGIDIRHIQELLGHKKPETTMIYTHVTTKQLTDIASPLDTLIENLGKDKENENEQKFRISGKF
jgi:site-specific recombinase XerD